MSEGKQTALQGLVAKAMAWRVKYRVAQTQPGGGATNTGFPIPIRNLGVHPNNRGGVYPSGLRCQSLCQEVLKVGFVKEEVNHAAVAVQETPREEDRSRGSGFVTGRTYNVKHSKEDELLCTCFQEPYDDVSHMLLSHNHMELVLRAFVTGARWELPALQEAGIPYCDNAGKLSAAVVAQSQNGAELAELFGEGILCEVLSWRMDAEEPTAATVISQALNKGTELALRTTEITAVAVLKGAIMTELSMDVSQRVAFESVRDRCRSELDVAADDPDLALVFDFLISVGAGRNTFIDDFLTYAAKFVDSKKRQLRLQAFGRLNAIPEKFPWTKIAVLKRAYRAPPVNGFCPAPESTWGKMTHRVLQALEELLRFSTSPARRVLKHCRRGIDRNKWH